MSGIGLLAHDNVRWLITSEPDVKKQIQSFIAGQAEPVIDVAGPPSASDLLKYKENPGGAVTLPCVRLKCRMTEYAFKPAVEVTCSDMELQELARWRLMASVRDTLRH
jgi:hypothetical protein